MNQKEEFLNGMPAELNDDALDSVSGGESVNLEGYSMSGKGEFWCNTCKAKTWHAIYFRFRYNDILICEICGSTRGGAVWS